MPEFLERYGVSKLDDRPNLTRPTSLVFHSNRLDGCHSSEHHCPVVALRLILLFLRTFECIVDLEADTWQPQ